MKRQVEIDDDLQERIDGIKEDIKQNFIDYLKENPDISDWDTYYQAQGCEMVHEICDSATPIHYSHIDGLYYLYGDEFDEAYKNAGWGNSNEQNHRQVAIYSYLSDKGFEYLGELEEHFNEFFDGDENTITALITYLESKG